LNAKNSDPFALVSAHKKFVKVKSVGNPTNSVEWVLFTIQWMKNADVGKL